jgi:hypothetical protein
MDGITGRVTLPEPLLRAARDVAAAREITVQELIRQALKEEVARHHRAARSPVRADERMARDERMIGMCRARFAEDFAYAANWWDLILRLREKGVHLREAGGGLALFGAHGGVRMCKASDVGWSLNKLALRFKAPFPGDKLGQQAINVAGTSRYQTDVVEPPQAFWGDWPEFPPDAVSLARGAG